MEQKGRKKDSYKEAEIQKIVAESKKFEEERLKTELERKKLEREINAPFYKKSSFLKVIISSILALPIIWFYFTQVALPLGQSKEIKMALENEKTRNELLIKQKEFEKETERLTSEKKR